MKIRTDKNSIDECLEQFNLLDFMSNKDIELMVIEYLPGEMITVSDTKINTDLFQVLISGNIQIYYYNVYGKIISEDVSNVHLCIGEYELIGIKNDLYIKALSKVITLGFSITKYKNILLNDPVFLLSCYRNHVKLTDNKMKAENTGLPLIERVLIYMDHQCKDGILKGLESHASLFKCSSRQLQRTMNALVADGTIKKIGKGTYQVYSLKADK